MKKHTLKALLAALTLLALIISASACTRIKKKTETPTSTLETPTYLEGENPTDTPTDAGTDIPDGPSDNPTEAPTPAPTETPTEAPTEPAPSLEYKSFGNGTCSVVGIGTIEDLYIVIPEKSPEGDVVTTVEAGAFSGNSDITVIQISSTVYSIGELAFADCKSLVHIAVDENNSHFRDIDGVLFNADMTNLISYPAAKASTSLLLPETVTTISSMALYGCDELKMIKFEGTVEQWAAINIGEKNYGIYTASLIFAEN